MVKTKILVADDHLPLRRGICHLLKLEQDFEVVADAADANEAVELTTKLVPDVVIMGGLAKLSSLEATKQIKAMHPSITVLVFTVHYDDDYLLGLFEAGARGYLLKPFYGNELVEAIRAVRIGEFVLHPTIGRRLLEWAARKPLKLVKLDASEQLTAREFEVLRLVARGLGNQA